MDEALCRRGAQLLSLVDRVGRSYADSFLKEKGVGRGQVPYLMELYHHDGVSQDYLAQKAAMDKSTAARAIQKLEAAGLIRRESRPGSREAVVQYVGAENCRGHLHLTCTRCGRTVHLSSAAASLLTGMAVGEGFSLDLTRTALYGLCPRCRQEVQP